VQYEIGGTAEILLSPDAKPTVQIDTPILRKWWLLNAVGLMSASVSIRVGPVFSVVVAPGIFVTIVPTITGEMNWYGEFAFEQAHESIPANLAEVSWADEVDCPSRPVRPAASRSVGKGNVWGNSTVAVKGVGFSLPEEGDTCVAVGVLVRPGVEIRGLGPPPGTELAEVFAAMCDSMMEEVKATVSKSTLAPAAVNCVGRQALQDGRCRFRGWEDFGAVCQAHR